MFYPSVLVATVLMICLTVQLSRADWDQEARDYVLEIHNEMRRGEGGCHINKLIYDQGLEAQAKTWAQRCVFKHENKEGRGENLAWDSNPDPEKVLIKGAADAWFNEKNTYSYGQRSCSTSMSCHYTQLVWGSTSKVGCYSTRCGYLSGGAANAWYLVCFYTPKGNWNGEKPYEKGCSSQCLEGQTEDNGLCVGEGVQKPKVCEDKNSNCAMWARNRQCIANPGFMKAQCQKSCNAC